MTTKFGTWDGEPELEVQEIQHIFVPRAKIKVLHETAANLQYATTHSAGLDLVSCEDTLILSPGSHATINSGVSLELLSHQVAFIFSRSGLGIKHGVTLRNGTGVIDADYKGPLLICLKNDGTDEVVINKGDRIAQLVITDFQRVHNVQVIQKERGTDGFGSTGTA